MKAVIYRGTRNIKVEDLPTPKASDKETLVKFKAGSICGTDLHFYRGEWTWLRTGNIIGHDACGVRVVNGERVAMVPIIYCGSCYFCLRGLQTLCESGKVLGFHVNGLFAEFVALPTKNLIPIPESVSDEEAAILEPVALAIRTLDSLQPRLMDWVTIIGQGPIGLLMTQVAKLKGCQVIAIDMQDYRLKLSQRYGADICINAVEENVIKRVKEITKRGSDIVIEAAGKRQAVKLTPSLVRKAGKVALIGESKGYLNLEKTDEAPFITYYISPIEYPMALNLISKKIVDVKGLITHKFKLDDFELAIKTADTPAEKPVKVVITG
jgi:threonine dehydrogenase-like Zn-dependent dehydrogenase